MNKGGSTLKGTAKVIVRSGDDFASNCGISIGSEDKKIIERCSKTSFLTNIDVIERWHLHSWAPSCESFLLCAGQQCSFGVSRCSARTMPVKQQQKTVAARRLKLIKEIKPILWSFLLIFLV